MMDEAKTRDQEIKPNETVDADGKADAGGASSEEMASDKPQKLKLTLRKTERGRVIGANSTPGGESDPGANPVPSRNSAAAQTTVIPVVGPQQSQKTADTEKEESAPSKTDGTEVDDLAPSKKKTPLKLDTEGEAEPKLDKKSPVKAKAHSSSDGDVGTTTQAETSEAPRPDGKPRLKVRSKTVPPGAENAPDREVLKKREKKKQSRQKASALHYGCAFVSLLLVFAGNALTAMPAWRRAVEAEVLPVQELVVLGVVTLVMGLLFFSRRMPLRILAGLLVFLMMCAGLFVTFYGYIPSSWVGRMSTETLSQFASPTLMLSAVLLFFGAFVLNTGGRGWQWMLSTVCLVIAAIFPFLPESALGSIGFGGTLAIPGIDPVESFGDGWIRATMTPAMGLWRSEKGDAECMAQKWDVKDFDSLDDFVEARRKDLEAQGFGSPAMFPVFGRNHQIQATMFAEDRRLEFLAVRGKENYYSIEFKMERGAYPDYRGFIKEIFVGIP
jgi:hypothetical protein